VRHAYGFDLISFSSNGSTIAGNGSGQTIAIVDAYDDPNISSDLAAFDQQFGLAAPPTFTKVGLNASGTASTTTFPTADRGWAGEIALDVEWAHAIAPGANILLVEAYSANLTDLLNAVDYARKQTGVAAVSMSWGSSEFSGEASYDSYFTTPSGHSGVTFFGSSGDSGAGAIWPAISSHVVAVGGTSLTLNSSGNYQSESGWSGSGGGLSRFVSQPTYQSGLVIHNGTQVVNANGERAAPDVSAVADPNTGVAVYSSYGFGGWAQVGGTSDAAPQWAALMAIVDQGRALAGLGALDGYTQTLPMLYQLPGSDFHDVTSGSNGYAAGAGFDLVTGRGTPVANLLVPGLVNGAGSTAHPPTVATAAHVVSSTSTTVTLNAVGTDSEGDNDLTYTWTVTGNPPGSVSFSPNGTSGASTTTATLTRAGTYNFQVTITDSATGLTAISQVSFTVNPILTSISVSPASANVVVNGTQQFTATAKDQFGIALASQPSFTWSIASGVGTISTTGLYTAPASPGSATVKAASGTVSGSAGVTVSSATGPTITMAAHVISQSSTTANLGVLATDPAGASTLKYTWSVIGTAPGSVTFSPNGTNAAQNTTATFSAPGTYNLLVTVTDPNNLSVTSTVTVTLSSSSLLFSDNFESGAGQWTVHSGSYYLATLSNGNHRLLVENYGEVSRIVAGSSSWTNYSFQGTVTLLNSYSGSVSLLARVQDDNHLYFFGYSTAYGAWFIARKDGPTVTTLLAVGAPFTAYYNQDYVVRADLSGSSLKLYVGGVLQVSATDSTYASGKIGFSSTWAFGTLDDVTVTALPAPTLARPASAGVAGSALPPGLLSSSVQRSVLVPSPVLTAGASSAISLVFAGSARQQVANNFFGGIPDLFWELYGRF
jgi:hypothetical protein